MTDFPALLLQIQDHRSYGAIGGLAVGTRTTPRFTKDLDLAVASANDSASEELIFALQAGGYRLVALLEQQATADWQPFA